MRKWWHLEVLKHHEGRRRLLGIESAPVYGYEVFCSCGRTWWPETHWRNDG